MLFQSYMKGNLYSKPQFSSKKWDLKKYNRLENLMLELVDMHCKTFVGVTSKLICFSMVALGTSLLSGDLLHLCCSIQCWIKFVIKIGVVVCLPSFSKRVFRVGKGEIELWRVFIIVSALALILHSRTHCSVGVSVVVRNFVLLLRNLVQVI